MYRTDNFMPNADEFAGEDGFENMFGPERKLRSEVFVVR